MSSDPPAPKETTATETTAGAPPAEGPSSSLRLKAIVLFLVIAVLPAALVAMLLININREAVEISERRLQAAVLSELTGDVLRRVNEAREDANAVATALAFAAMNPDQQDGGIGAVKSLLATRKSIDVLRFEVPSAKVSTIIVRQDAVQPDDPPKSTKKLRANADERGVAFTIDKQGRGVIVVPIPRDNPTRPAGYITAPIDLAPLNEQLEIIADTRFDGGSVSILISDNDRRAVASYGVAQAPAGTPVGELPVWRLVPDGTPWTTHVGVVGPHTNDGVAMVGGVESVAELGWGVAVWRPQAVAYATLDRMQRQSYIVGLAALLLALIVGLAAAKAVTTPVLQLVSQARLIGRRDWSKLRLDTKRKDELGQLFRSMKRMAVDLESGEAEIEHQAKLRGDLSRFMSRELVEQIVAGEHSLALGGKRADVSVVFADVVAFTPLAESRPAEEVVGLLNDLFSVLSEVVFRHEGTVDKFIGDCIMAVWGAPVAQSDHAERALAAVEDMMRFLETANDEWRDKYGVEIRIGIGVNSGEAIVGNIGSQKRMEYTVIGDVVNVAARLEAVAQPNQVLVTERTMELAGDDFEAELLGEQQLTGRSTATKVYQLVV